MSLKTVIRVGFYLMCGVFACTAQSQDKLYQCTVKQILEVDEAGYLKPIQALGVTHIGDTFSASDLMKKLLPGLFYFLHTIKHINQYGLALIGFMKVVWM